MKISVELTLTPLQDDFRPPIKQFIKRLRASHFTVKETPLSTQIYGDYEALMPFLTTEIRAIFQEEEAIMMHMKLVKGDRSDYIPDF